MFLFFFLIIRQPPISTRTDTLFPYATLFRSQALDHVAAYTCMAENSVRDFQKHAQQATAGKNFDRSGALGPWMVTADETPDPSRLRVRGLLNGVDMKHGSVADLIFSIPDLIA